MIKCEDEFRKEPDAGKPHVRICEGRIAVRGASTRPVKKNITTTHGSINNKDRLFQFLCLFELYAL